MDNISVHLPAKDRVQSDAAALRVPRLDTQFSAADLRSVVGVLLRHLRLILGIPLAAVAITIGVLHLVEPQYKSAIAILIR